MRKGVLTSIVLILICLLVPFKANAADEALQVYMLRKVFSSPVTEWGRIISDNKKLVDNSFFERVEQRMRWSLDNGQVEDAIRFAYVGDLAGQCVGKPKGYRLQMSQLFRKLGNATLALDLANSIVVSDPENKEANFYKASLLHDTSQLVEAYKIYEKLSEQNFRRSDCLYRMGSIELAIDKIEEGRDHLRQSIKLNPKNDDAKALLDKLEAKLADATFIPKDPAAPSSSAIPFANAGNLPISTSDATKAAAVMVNANEARDEHQYTRAIELYKAAIELNPKLAEAYMFLGTVYFQDKNLEEAMRNIAQSITLEPNNAKAHRYLGYCYERLYDAKKDASNLAKAKECYVKSQLLDPNDTFISYDLKRIQSK